MNNAWDEVTKLLDQAREVAHAARHHADRMARMLNEPGALQGASPYELRRLKTALRKFDMTTGKWKR